MGMLLRRNRTSLVENMDAPVQEIELASPVNEVLEIKETVEELITEEVVEEKQLMFPYTKTEVNRMATADLKKLARKYDIDKSLSGTEIKKQLIAKYGL